MWILLGLSDMLQESNSCFADSCLWNATVVFFSSCGSPQANDPWLSHTRSWDEHDRAGANLSNFYRKSLPVFLQSFSSLT